MKVSGMHVQLCFMERSKTMCTKPSQPFDSPTSPCETTTSESTAVRVWAATTWEATAFLGSLV
eukprot:8608841-Alexandrium_andersonii.AAC.1